MAGTIIKCPVCKPPVVRHADGRRIAGWLPPQIYVGFLILPRWTGVPRPPIICPECQSKMTEVSEQ